MRIIFCIASLELGGAEKVAAILADRWAMEGYDVIVATTNHEADGITVSSRVKRISLANKLNYKSYPRIWRLIVNAILFRRIFKKWQPDIIVSFLDASNLSTILASRFLGIPIVISERGYPFRESYIYSYIKQMVYNHADAVVVQTQSVANTIKNKNIRIIENPMVTIPRCGIKERKKYVLAMGRLDRVKGFDILIRAFSVIKTDWTLIIAGDGGERENLVNLITDLKQEARIKLPGVQDQSIMYEASIFVLSSLSEGLPNVLIEARACGLPIIAVRSQSGISELVHHMENGILLDSHNNLSDAIYHLINNQGLRERLSNNTVLGLERYGPRDISEEWIALFKDLLEK